MLDLQFKLSQLFFLVFKDIFVLAQSYRESFILVMLLFLSNSLFILVRLIIGFWLLCLVLVFQKLFVLFHFFLQLNHSFGKFYVLLFLLLVNALVLGQNDTESLGNDVHIFLRDSRGRSGFKRR